MKSPIYILSLFILLLFVSCSTADKSERKGDAALAIGEYFEAANHYKKAYSRTPIKDRYNRGRLSYKQAEAFRSYGYTVRALGAYRSAERYKYIDTLTRVRIGDMLRIQGDYKNAEKSYRAYLDSFPNDSIALQGIASCQEAVRLKAQGSAYTVKMDKVFNSNRSDYCPVYLPDADQIYFTSNRSASLGDNLSNITGQKNCDIFYVRKDEKGHWKMPEAVGGGLNSENDEGAIAFTADAKSMYLTVCSSDPTYPRYATIMMSSRSDGTWGKPQEVKISSDTLSSYAHPAISPDGQWLYFASDMAGGYGGLDLWRGTITTKGIGIIENLGPSINTAGNECFPAFRPQGDLYFSSDGRVGMGGLDLYRAVEDSIQETWKVEHLPSPMNSSGDDFGITFDGLHNRGYFSSSRSTRGRGWDKLYEFSYPEHLLSVKGWVYEQDGYELPNAVVYMIGNDGTNEKISVKSDGSFEQPVKSGVSYMFLATCQDYLNQPNQLFVDKQEEEYQYVLQFPLASITSPVLVRNVFYAFNSAELDTLSTTALDRLTRLLEENPHITIELAAHCDYRGDSLYNQNLSQRRAESVVRYLEAHGVDANRLTPVGYGESMPKIVNKKLAEEYPFLHAGDTLTESYILALDSLELQEICNSLNRRTEFRVLRTTFGLFDADGNINTEELNKKKAVPTRSLEEQMEDDDTAISDDADEKEDSVAAEDNTTTEPNTSSGEVDETSSDNTSSGNVTDTSVDTTDEAIPEDADDYLVE